MICPLADGSDLTVNYYAGVVVWDGQELPVTIYNMEGNPLIGMALMDNYKLVLDAKVGGTLTLTYNP